MFNHDQVECELCQSLNPRIYVSIQSNIVNVTFDLNKGSFASIMGFKTKGDVFFTLVRLLLIFLRK